MHRLGISIYPTQSDLEMMKDYIDNSVRYGFKRIFTNLLSVKQEEREIFEKFKEIVKYANKNDMEVIADINREVFKDLQIDNLDLAFFDQLGVSGIRIDSGFSAQEVAKMTHNKQNMFIELNISTSATFINDVSNYKPNKDNLIGCHNFYPQQYTGLSFNHFQKTSESYKQHQLTTAAFVTSQHGNIGPWKVMEGLPTLEDHRDLPIEVQAKHLLMTGLIDDIIISNAYATDEELYALSKINLSMPTLNIELNPDISNLEKKIVLEEEHFNRGDVSDYVIRSTMSRVHFKDREFPQHNTSKIEKGDILICNETYGHYKGEMQIALQNMENSGVKNVIGKINEDEHFLLDLIEPWQSFVLNVKE